MNTYRLLRSTQFVQAGSRLLGNADRPGEHQAILTLLAVAAGVPEEAEGLLVQLESAEEQTWPAFVAALHGSPRVAVALRATLPSTTLRDLEPYRRWAPSWHGSPSRSDGGRHLEPLTDLGPCCAAVESVERLGARLVRATGRWSLLDDVAARLDSARH